MEPIVVTSANENDAAVLSQIDAACFSVPIEESQMRSFITNSNYLVLKAVSGGTICGYVCMSYVLDEGNVYNLCVLPEFRTKGIAQCLMNELHRNANLIGILSIALEVRVSNEPAIHLYEKMGYKRVGRSKNHYSLPKEDAFIYVRDQEIEE